MPSQRVSYEIEQLRQIPTYEDQLKHLKTLPKGMSARVVGAIFDNTKAMDSAERQVCEDRKYIGDLARYLRAEERSVKHPFAVPSF